MATENTERAKRFIASKAQAILKEHGEFMQQIIDECMLEYSQEINEITADAVAMKYASNQGARNALRLFMKKLNSKANG